MASFLHGVEGDVSATPVGVSHEEGRVFTDPIDTKLVFHSGKPNQKADSVLAGKSLDGEFKLQQDYFEGANENYWGPNHRVLDTAYVVCDYKVSEGEISIPELEFIVKGRPIECYNYDHAYIYDVTKLQLFGTPAFQKGDTLKVFDSTDTDTGNTVLVENIIPIYQPDGSIVSYVRFDREPDANGDTAFGVGPDALNIRHFTTHDHVYVEGDVSETLESEANSVTPGNTSGTSATLPPSDTNSTVLNETDGNIDVAFTDVSLTDIDPEAAARIAETIGSFTQENQVSVSGDSPLGVLQDVGSADYSSTANFVVITNAVALPSTASAVDDFYNGATVEVTRILSDGTKKVQTRKIIDYIGSTKVATVDSSWDAGYIPVGSNTSPTVTADTVRVLAVQDKRVSTNPAMQLLDYLTDNRYGRGLELDQDINLATFKDAGRKCDQRSSVYVTLTSQPSVGDVLEYVTGSPEIRHFQGTVESVEAITLGSPQTTYYQVKFKDCIGKLGQKWNNWRTYKAGMPVWDDGNIAIGNDTTISTKPSSVAAISTLRDKDTPATTYTIDTSYKAFNGNPLVKQYDSESGNWIDGYELYDADEVTYWRYVGWEYQDQDFVTRHQTNITIDTSKPVFDNVNNILNHFNGILRYSAGKYELDLFSKKDADITVDIDSETYTPSLITEDDIIGQISVEDPGRKGTYNQVTVGIPDPGNKFENRSVTFLDSNYLKQDRNIPKKGDVKTPGVTNYYNARLNARQYLEESRYGLKISFTMPPKGYLLQAGEIITVTNSPLGFTAKPFRITNLTMRQDCLVQITAEEHTDTAYIVEGSGAETGSFLPPPPTFANVGKPPAASGLTATSNQTGGIDLSWTAPTGFNSNTDTFEIWRSTESDFYNTASPRVANAELIGTTKGTRLTDPILSETNNIHVQTPYY